MAQFRLDDGEGGEVKGTTISDGLGNVLGSKGSSKTALATQYNTADSCLFLRRGRTRHSADGGMVCAGLKGMSIERNQP